MKSVVDEQHGPDRCFFAQHFLRQRQHGGRVNTHLRHDRRIKAFEERFDNVNIFARRHHNVRASCVCDQRSARTGPLFDQVDNFEARPIKPRRLKVVAAHGVGDLHRDDERRRFAKPGALLFAPRRSCRRDSGGKQHYADAIDGPERAPRTAVHGQRNLQMRRDKICRSRLLRLVSPDQPPDQNDKRQYDQKRRTHEVK